MSSIVEIRSLSKTYNSGHRTLEQVDLNIRDGIPQAHDYLHPIEEAMQVIPAVGGLLGINAGAIILGVVTAMGKIRGGA